ncbi:unnamed protein product [Prorocentrum cordatum]|uniref:Uncharacterized protein n=1 Tax=Prorocentrum cordatum TaxID=2364126 RepID=A0ABN9UMV2_9DINO|nr:unnamed protein product [Polarella glacialis]
MVRSRSVAASGRGGHGHSWPLPGSRPGSDQGRRGALRALEGRPSYVPTPMRASSASACRGSEERLRAASGGGRDAQKCLCCFRVVLVRPSARVPWGFVWDRDVHDRTGARVVESVLDGSPLGRWNFWQDLRGRPDLCVIESDQLIKVDGKWAWHDHEVGDQDGESASAAPPGHGTSIPIVLDFARPATRQLVPLRPQLEVNEATATLVLDWSMSKFDRARGWALCIQDVSSGDWYAVDGFTSTAMPLTSPKLNDVGAFRPDHLSAWVSAGLPSGRTYSACVASLGSSGWTAFSGMSRPLSLPKFRSACGKHRESQRRDDWPERPRFACPSRLIAGASAPVELVSGPRVFSAKRRRLLLEMIMQSPPTALPGPVRWGIRLHLGSLERGGAEREVVAVYRLEPGLAAHRWCQAQQSATFHGAAVSTWLCPGDVIASANGLTQPAAILREVRRGPGALVLLVERETEGPSGAEEDHAMQDPVSAAGALDDEEVLRLNSRLDQDAAKAAEEVEWFVMLPELEGKIVTTMVGTRLLDLGGQLKEMTEALAYPSLFKDAQERMRVEAHHPKVSTILEEITANRVTPTGRSSFSRRGTAWGGEGNGRSNESAHGTGGERRSAQFFNRRLSSQGANMHLLFMALRFAMANPSSNEKLLQDAIDLFGTASKDVQTSQAGTALVHRARSLLELWQWRRSCAQARTELAQAHQAMLKEEARGPPAVTDTPPYDLSELHRAVERAKPYSSEFTFEFTEATESLSRLRSANQRCMAQRRMDVVAADPKEHPSALEAAVVEAEKVGVDPGLLADVRRGVDEAKQRKHQEAQHDELFAAVQDLQGALGPRTVPPAGTSEQRRVRAALASSGLPGDHQLVLTAQGLLDDWENSHAALRAEVKLKNAEKRCLKGFKLTEQSAGPTLASTIAEVAQRGVSADMLEHAKRTLSTWREKQVNVCLENLQLAINTKSEEFLKEAIKDARVGGVPAHFLEDATQKLLRLRLEEEVTGSLTTAMESGDIEQLELAIQQAHNGMFVEEESPTLTSAVLQVHLRLWAREFNQVLKEKSISGMDRFVPTAREAMERSREALQTMAGSDAGEVAIRTLERELRALDLLLPKFENFAAVSSAESQLRRVLGAVEKYAQDLPFVIDRAREQLPRGLDAQLLQECVEQSQHHGKTVEALRSAVAQPDVPLMQLKSAIVTARLAGADQDLIDSGLSTLHARDPGLWQYTNTELELLLALTEADDIEELDVEGRFLRLQDAAEKAKRLSPPLSRDTLAEVDAVYLALAAEQSLKFAVRDAEAALANRWAPTEEISACVGNLEQARLSVEQSALRSVRDKMLGHADRLQYLLRGEAGARLDAKQRMAEIWMESHLQDLKLALRDAREAFVPEHLLAGIYTELRRRKLEFIAKDWRAASIAGNHQAALAYWHRGVALEAAKERSGEDWLRDHLPGMENKWTRGTTIVGQFKRDGGGSFGSQTWRENPYFFVRPVLDEEELDESGRETTPGGPIQVTVYAVEASASTATLEVHAVQNKQDVAMAGCGTQLLPGFQVLASSSPDQDVPHCSFQVDAQAEELQPVFIVPSVAVGEEGGFRLLVEASRPVEIVEVGPSQRLSWQLVAEEDVEWAARQPHSVVRGGGRPASGAPRLSWYRNPQFEVEYTGEEPAWQHDVFQPGTASSSVEKQSDDAEKPSAEEIPSTTPDELLFVLLVPVDKRHVHPAALHLLRNKQPQAQEGLRQNPWHHELLASSCGPKGSGYSTDSELGAVCVVQRKRDEKIIVVPSLESDRPWRGTRSGFSPRPASPSRGSDAARRPRPAAATRHSACGTPRLWGSPASFPSSLPPPPSAE